VNVSQVRSNQLLNAKSRLKRSKVWRTAVQYVSTILHYILRYTQANSTWPSFRG